jgi:bifunctional non-homologous end joining protein LigD
MAASGPGTVGHWGAFALCDEVEDPAELSGEGWLIQRKLDGVRVLASRERVRTRGHAYPNTGLTCAGGGPVPRGALLDGELMLRDGAHFTGVRPALERQRWDLLELVPFDALCVRGTWVDRHPLRFRRQLLEALAGTFLSAGERIEPLPWLAGSPTEVAADAQRRGWEGLIFKRPDSPYPRGRTSSWVKWKVSWTVEAEVMGFEEGSGAHRGTAGTIVFGLRHPDGRLIEAGRCAGMTRAQREACWADQVAFVGRTFRLRHYGLSKARLRNPIFKGWVT